ncbi:MAG: cysteine synthase family protein [Oscillospiraceae bacterium]|nr:cysteine synthase family protein [Oscillospiraceae bacterium]
MNVLDCVGNTPLLEINMDGCRIYAKAEYFNPSGSVKDRAAKLMLLEAIADGRLTKDKIILDSTSGNTGIAYAMFGAALGYKVTLCLPSNASMERKKILKAYGAEIIETDPLESSDGAYLKAVEIAKSDPDKYFFPDQYNNDANWKAHYYNTAVEILKQTAEISPPAKPGLPAGRVSSAGASPLTHFVAGTGTSGTFTGIAKRLKEDKPDVIITLMQPDSPFHGLEGMKHMETTLKPGFFNREIADREIEVGTEEAYNMVRRLAKEQGIFVGVSSGANVHAALEIAKTAPKDAVIVTILCDNGYRYLTEPIWRDL